MNKLILVKLALGLALMNSALVGSVEDSRGCSDRCRHCRVPVVYDGRVRVVDEAFVVANVDRLVAAGVGHVFFADPIFSTRPVTSVESSAPSTHGIRT